MSVIDLQQEELELEKEKTYLVFTVPFFVISLVAVLFAVAGLYLYIDQQKKETEKIRSDIQAVSSEIADLEEKSEDARAVQQKLGFVNGLFDSHVCMVPLFDVLEDSTVSGVYFESFELQADSGLLALTGKATSYKDAADQLAIWRDNSEYFSDVQISEVSLDQGGNQQTEFISFSPVLTLNTSLFNCKEQLEDNNE